MKSIVSRVKSDIYLSKWFFYVLILLLPIQTRKIFFTEMSFYGNYHAFYNTFYLYLTDLLLIGLIIAWLWESRGFLHKIHKIYTILLSFWLILAISVLISRENYLSLYGLAKFSQFLLFFAYIREKVEFSREKAMIFAFIVGSGVLQAVLSIYQYISQKSAGLRFLGEEYLRPALPGIAEFFSREIWQWGSEISDFSIPIRAYGTFPHPNVLAGFLFVAFIFNLFLLYQVKFSRENWWKSLGLGVSLLLISTGLVVAFSRLAWAVTALGIVIFFAFVFIKLRKPEQISMRTGRLKVASRKFSPKNLSLILLLLTIGVALNWYFFGVAIQDRLTGLEVFEESVQTQTNDYLAEESIAQRQFLNQQAWSMIQEHPVLGVGLRNFVVRMSDFAEAAPEEFKVGDPAIDSGQGRLKPFLRQPVHNIYLLLAAEAGLLALFVFLVFLFNIVRPAINKARQRFAEQNKDLTASYTLLIVCFGLLFIGLFDHYGFTLQQGGLLFWMSLGLLSAQAK